MVSCIRVLYRTAAGALLMAALTLPPVLAFPAPPVQGEAADPDRLYANRVHVPDARRAADLWAERLARDPKDFEAATKLARARYYLGGKVEGEDARKRQHELGMEAARAAIAVAPNRPEGHFWLAANQGALAELGGMFTGLKYRGSIRDGLRKVLEIDPAFLKGSADRALGRWYYKVPGLFGGSKKKSEEHLRKALTYAPDSILSHLFLAETLLEMDRHAEARAELRIVLETPPDPDWAAEDADHKARARELLAELDRKAR